MCDYSLHVRSQHVPLRSRKPWFRPNFLQGRGALRARTIRMSAVCLRPGTEIAFENDVQTSGMMFRKNIGVRLALRHFSTKHYLTRPLPTSRRLSNSRERLQSFLITNPRCGAKGLRYCNCLRAQSRKGLRRPNLRLV